MTDPSENEPRIVRSDGHLTDEDARRLREALRQLDELSDEDIDLSDMPEMTDFSRAVRGKFYRPVKDEVTLALNRFVLHWFMLAHDDYRAAINDALAEHVRRERTAKSDG